MYVPHYHHTPLEKAEGGSEASRRPCLILLGRNESETQKRLSVMRTQAILVSDRTGRESSLTVSYYGGTWASNGTGSDITECDMR